jgi:hypothetical protein
VKNDLVVSGWELFKPYVGQGRVIALVGMRKIMGNLSAQQVP